ncbi:hypothetical protein ACSS6W_006702 [Trichoderma asperelloides]
MYVVVGQLPSCFNSVACPSPPLWVWRIIWDLRHGCHPAATYLPIRLRQKARQKRQRISIHRLDGQALEQSNGDFCD